MRDRMERFVLLPFTFGCVSEASVAVGVQQPRMSKPEEANTYSSAIRDKEEEEHQQEQGLSNESMKSSYRFLAIPKPNISSGFHRLFKSLKNLSQLFAYKEEVEEEEEEEMEMEIGLPTDVKHVTHIGLDGSATTNPIKGWDNLIDPELLSLPSVSLKQFELSKSPSQATC